MESDGKKQESHEKKQMSDEKEQASSHQQYEANRKSAAPLEPPLRRSTRLVPVPAARASASASAPTSTMKPKGEKGEEDENDEGPKPKMMMVRDPEIPKLLPFVTKLTPEEGLGSEAAEGSLVLSQTQKYKSSGKHTQGKCPLYGISFNFMDARYYDIFATVGGNRVTIYRCLKNGTFDLLQAYVDEDNDEEFYTLSWACNHVDGNPVLVAAGKNRIIRAISCATKKLAKSFVGHGGCINELRTQALKPSLIISASKDQSIRLWNIHTGICILIFAGSGGHTREVLSVDFHPSDIERFVSSGMDGTVRIWSMKEFWPYVDKSYTWTDLPSKFPTKYVQLPILMAAVHSNYVDCTRWLGDFILSKSVENEIVLWEPKTKEQSRGKDTIDILQKYPVPKCDVWFIKFSCDFHFNQLAIGNCEGEVFVWEVQSSPPVLTARLANSRCKSTIRQTATSFDGSTILGVGDDGNIWRWDEVDHPSIKN